MELCPCGSNAPYQECCEPRITGASPAVTAEELMRSRYTAYVTVATDYIFNTTHPQHRSDYDPVGTREWAKNSEWLGLEILATEQGGTDHETGTVEFIAHYREKGVDHHHHELGHFKKDDGVWYFTDGALVTNKPIIRGPKVGRNDPCPCGSSLKFKKCCGK